MTSDFRGSYPGHPSGELLSCEITLLNQLNERRDSTTSTLSSAYTFSRRSSGISPCCSSRRSSDASQFGANRHNNISSADSYDPISTDLLFSLTPAQHYRLKAKYAAAIGGAPPTPLPNMNRISLRTRMALYSDSQEGSMTSFLQPPGRTVPRRCSETGYGSQSMMPHEVPTNLPRRASDPVRLPPLDPLSLPSVQRYNSMNNINPMNNPSTADRHMQGCTRSDGSLQWYPFAPRPPSISENFAIENMAVDGVMTSGDHSVEDEVVLPDDVVQYLRSQNSGLTGQNYNSNCQTQGYQTSMAPPLHFHGQRRMAMVDTTMAQDMQSYQRGPNGSQQPFPAPPDNRNNMPVQWNEGYVNHSHQSPMNTSLQQQHQQRQHNSTNLNEPMSNQQGFSQEESLRSLSGNSSLQPALNTMASVELQICRTRTQMGGYCHVNQVDQEKNYSISFKQQQHGVQNGTREMLQPRPPNEPKSFSRQHPVSGVTQPSHKVADLNPSNITVSSEASPKRQSKGLDHNSSDNQNSTVFYTGQIHMFEPSSNSIDDSISPCTNEATSSSHSAAANMASPGVNQVSSSTVDSSTSRSGATEHAQIDFDTMLDDGDHSSLVSGTLSPGLLQSLSQSSSRLTTPRNSVTLTSVPAGIGNMAIGDMNSMLTALAEESKFLNMIS
ncbi:hypothetical protein GOODEAATRI_025825 [Goodea atripinnis]|uniref:Uncharacterized protein n=1 Tax=Goodea atripinnis TaxID=208336 RepID=A0ABV0NY41_9TELE